MTDVLIVGAGPTGLAMAYELTRRGIDVRIIDQAGQPSTHSKALGIQSRTLEVLEKMDILSPFLKNGLPLTQLSYHYYNKSTSFNLYFPDEVPFPYLLILPQSDTEKYINDALESLGKKVDRGISLKRIEPKEFAILQHADGNEEIVYPKWIIGCDGAHSTVRQSLGIPFKGSEFTEAFVLADVELDTSIPHKEIHMFLSSKGLCGIIPLPENNQYRLLLPFIRERQIDKNMLDVNFLQKVSSERISGYTLKITSLMWTSLFYVRRNIVPHLRYHNVFLAGDAAHVHSPAGGQGLNTSVQDAQNLAWKLALVMKGYGHKVLIDSYEKERLPVAKAVLEGTTKATKIMRFFQKHFRTLTFRIFSFMLSKNHFRKKLSLGISELDIEYSRSPIIHYSFEDLFWSGPRPGERAPDVVIDKDNRLYTHLKDLRHVLLFFDDKKEKLFLEKINAQYSHLIKLLVISNEDPQSHSSLKDNSNKIVKGYNAQPGTLYLIRPDGYIAYRKKKFHQANFFKYLEKIFNI